MSPQGSISTTEHPCSTQCPLFHSEITQDRGWRSLVSPTALQNSFNIFLEPLPAYVMVWLRRLGGWGLNTEQFDAQR